MKPLNIHEKLFAKKVRKLAAYETKLSSTRLSHPMIKYNRPILKLLVEAKNRDSRKADSKAV